MSQGRADACQDVSRRFWALLAQKRAECRCGDTRGIGWAGAWRPHWGSWAVGLWPVKGLGGMAPTLARLGRAGEAEAAATRWSTWLCFRNGLPRAPEPCAVLWRWRAGGDLNMNQM